MQLGTASADPGELTTGYFDVTDLPTGGSEQLPVIIAEGEHEGPELWITGSIHGDEATGLATAHDTMREDLPETLSGRVVCLPTLNPAGLRRNERTSYYHDDDPNRYFPDPTSDRARPPRVQELINERVYDAFADSADALIDLHTAGVGSFPFVIRDRVLYGEERTEAEADDLADELAPLVEAYDLPLLNEYAVDEYTEQNLQRSTAGAALNNAGIPAFTVELGSHSVVDDPKVAAGVAGNYRVMVAMDMLDAVPDDIAAADPDYRSPIEYPVKRARHPHTETPGIVRHRVEAGDTFEAGDPIADIYTPHGDHKTTVTTDHDGYVIGRKEGAAVYENDPLCSLAVRDDGDLVVPRDDNE
ncbi:MAG: succinylglutamate desuccinylase/aspartoacylase family protein [Halobacteriales archaeon]